MPALTRFTSSLFCVTAVAAVCWLGLGWSAKAADHQDAPNLSSDLGADINDVFFFLDPNDNTQAVLGMTAHGFIIPGEALNLAVFDPTVLFRFYIENTGDAKPDAQIDVTFSPRQSTTTPQTATVTLPTGEKFTAPTTLPTLASVANPQVITTDAKSGALFFAGEADDPFFFDIPAFDAYVATAKAKHPDPTVFNRGRDSFAGYNTLSIAIRVPVAMLKGRYNASVIGVSGATYRKSLVIDDNGNRIAKGNYFQIDRMGNPTVNVALIPFADKNAYNSSSTMEDANGKFATDIVSSLEALGTDNAHIATLAGIAVAKGDFLHLNTTIANSGPKGGTNSAASYPNGRRPADDTVDIILTLINNGVPLGDNVNASDIPPQDTFPFFALPQQPRAHGVIDDNTRN